MSLQVRNLTSGYRTKIVISNVSFSLQPGEIMTFLGHNGAGKSTTLKTILGVLKPVEGEVWLDGTRIDGLPVADRLERGLRMLPEGRGVFPDLTVGENIDVVAQLNCVEPDCKIKVEDVQRLFPILVERRDSIAGNMSGGQQQQLAFALAILGSPKCILLEEPSVGLQPDLVENLFAQIHTICKQHSISAILVEHKVASAMKIADHVLIMNNGEVVFDGSPAKARESNFWEFF
jgi:branched-chain amino acid transport system ATP-binding protein